MKKWIACMGLVGVGIVYLLAFDAKSKKDEVTSSLCSQGPAVIHSQKIANEYYRAKNLAESLTKNFNAAQKEFLSMLNDFEKMAQEYRDLEEKSGNPALTEEAKKKVKVEAEGKLEILRQKEHAIRDFKTNSENRLNEMRLEEGTKISATVRQKIEEVAKTKGLTLVIDGDSPLIFYSAGALDITEHVLGVLNADQPQVPSTAKTVEEKK
ncbi:MAG: OmpH family outer membrane protein [Puniceicoccales bacterium]|nr:OmpH family outer membrane protein [Puniceicoccales bacterium]